MGTTVNLVYHPEYNADALHIDCEKNHGEVFIEVIEHFINHPKGHSHPLLITEKVGKTGVISHTNDELHEHQYPEGCAEVL